MKKILIIDYDQNSLSSLQGVFSGMGYQVVTAPDGQAGWDKYNKESPDLVLMEAMLPKVHGFELCQRITSERSSQATVFIMTGVYKDRVYRTEALRTYGASEYFEKPLKMTELITSVEAVLGKPEPRPAQEPQAAAPVPAPPAAAGRKPKIKSDDSIFALPEDLDRLSRETPKPRKPAAPRSDPAAGQRFEAMADQLLKTVLVEASETKTAPRDPSGGNGNGNGNGNGKSASPDIDRFLKSALAGLDLSKEKVKAARPAVKAVPPPETKPEPAPVRPAAPDIKPAAPPVRPAAPEIRPTPPPAPPAAPRVPEKPMTPPPPADMKSALTPGDPGSDVSPFFKPEAAKPARPVEQPEKRQEPRRSEPLRVERPDNRPAERAHPAPAAATKPDEKRVLAASSIFQETVEPEEKKGFPKIVAVVLGVAAVAAAGFILLRPKRPAPLPAPPPRQEQPQQQEESQPAELGAETAAASKQVEEPPAPVVKPAPAKQKVQPPPKPAEQAPAQAIIPDRTMASTLPMPGTRPGAGANRTASGKNAPAGSPAAPKPDESARSAAKTAATPPAQTTADEAAAAPDPAPPGTTSAPAVSAPAPAPVQEGDLVELGAVSELPKVVKKVDPIYPATAQRIGREGSITVNALIDEKGDVIDTAIIKGIQDDKGLGRAAEVALRKWKFEPARKDGVAVKVWKTFVIAFKADANPAGEQ